MNFKVSSFQSIVLQEQMMAPNIMTQLSEWFYVGSKLETLNFASSKREKMAYWISPRRTIKMAGRSIALFRFLRKFYRAVGIHPSQSDQNYCSFNRKNVVFCLCLVPSTIATAAFFLFKAESISDFELSLFFLPCCLLCLALYLILIWQIGKILKFIEDCEEFIERSMCWAPKNLK